MMKSLVIFNPTAGLNTKTDVEKMIKEKLQSLGYEAAIFYLNPDFEKNIIGCDFSSFDLVVAVGGDGTVKVATRVILENKINAPLVILPFGSANVIASDLGLPLNVKSALNLLEKTDKTIAIDVGVINRRHYFLVGFSAGYISRVVSGTSLKLKNRLGNLSYIFSFIFSRIAIKKIKFKVQTKKRTFWVKGNSLVVFNALNYYGVRIKKKIDFQDGILNLYVFTNRTFISLVEAFFYLLWYQKPPRHVFAIDNDYFKIYFKKELDSCQIDGDYVSLGREIEIKVINKALRVVVGK